MATRLSIRSYSFASHTHSHDHHQLVLPLAGVVDIHTGRHQGRGAPGQCIITLAGHEHRFAPGKGSCFLVADLDRLPDNLQAAAESFVRVSPAMQAFCFFVQKQLEQAVSPSLEHAMGEWFERLMGEQTFAPSMDPRIARAVELLEQDIGVMPSLAELGAVAFLGVSQLKALFRKETGYSVGAYLLTLRMNKARALLVHTDYPVGLIAGRVGYQDVSAFSRRFAAHFGHSPRQLRGRA